MFGLCHFGLSSVPCTPVHVCNIFCLDFATLDCNTFVWTVISGQCVFCKWLNALTIFCTMYVVHVVYHSCYLHVLYIFNCNILGFRGFAGFGFGDGFSPESIFGADSGFRFGFRFWVPRHSTRSEPTPLAFLPTRGPLPLLIYSRGVEL